MSPHTAKTYRQPCKTCVYRASEISIGNCDYILIVGESRGCDSTKHCAKYKEGPRIRHRLGPTGMNEIIKEKMEYE